MTTEELQKILKDHANWLEGAEDGKRADLRGANLRYANLEGTDFRWAKLQGADFRLANLEGANLKRAKLEGANLRYANLEGADFRWAKFQGADLRGADLRGANLQGVDIRGADLRGANLQGVDIRKANLQGAFVPMYCRWDTSIVDGKIKVGCIAKSPGKWLEWLASDHEYETKRGTEEFKQIEAVIRAHITYLKVLNDEKRT